MTGFCLNCGQILPSQARFCVTCGAPREAPAAAQTVADDATTVLVQRPVPPTEPPRPTAEPATVPPLPPAPAPPPVVRPPVAQPPTASAPAAPPISGYEAGRWLKKRMSIAGAVCGTVMGFLIGFGGPIIREVLDNPPNVLLGALIVLVLLGGPWAAWHLWGNRARLVLLANADDLAMPWLGGAFFMVLAGSCALIVCMVMSRSGSYGERNFMSWMGIQMLSSVGLMVLGAVLDVVRRRRAGAGSMPGPGRTAYPRSLGGAPSVGVVGSGPSQVDMAPYYAAQRRAYIMGGLKLIATGVGIVVLGVIGTIALSALFSGVGTVIIATGAIVVGLINIVRGLYYILIRGFIR